MSDLKDIKDIINAKGLIKVPQEPDSPYRKVAKFLFLIGADEASRVIKKLGAEQVDKIVKELVTIQKIEKEEAEEILKEFSHLYNSGKVSQGGVDTARSMLEKAFGTAKAQSIIDTALPDTKKVNFDYLKDIDTDTLSVLLEGEMIATKALILSQLSAQQVAKYISRTKDKKEIVKAMIDIKSVSSTILFEVSEAMKKKLAGLQTSNTAIDGKSSLINILRCLDYKNGNELIASIAEDGDESLAQELKEQLFTIDDVLNIPDFQMQRFLFGFEDELLIKLIHAKNDAFRRKILVNLSEGRSKRVAEEEHIREHFLKKDVQEATNMFMQKVREANEKGELEIGRGGEGEWV